MTATPTPTMLARLAHAGCQRRAAVAPPVADRPAPHRARRAHVAILAALAGGILATAHLVLPDPATPYDHPCQPIPVTNVTSAWPGDEVADLVSAGWHRVTVRGTDALLPPTCRRTPADH